MNDILYHVFIHSSIKELRIINRVSKITQQLLNKHFWLNKIAFDNLDIIIPSLFISNDWFKIYNTILLIKYNIDVYYNFIVIIRIVSFTQEQLRHLLQSYNVYISFDILYIDYFKNNVTFHPVPIKIGPSQNMIKSELINVDYQYIVNFLFEAYMNGFILDFVKI